MKKILIFSTLIFFASYIFGLNPAEKQFDFSISGGIIGSGVFQAAWYDDFAPNETVTGISNPSFMARSVS